MRHDDHGPLALRVAIADDHRPFAHGLAAWLGELGAEVTGVAGSAHELMALVDRDPPDLVMVDVAMPPDRGDEGIRFAEDLDVAHPAVGVLLVSSYEEPAWAQRLLACRQQGVGYLLKDSIDDSATLRDALRRVSRGEVLIDPRIVAKIAVPPPHSEVITDRELEVLAEMAAGRSNKAVADSLGISPRTVENHIRRILQKLEIGDDPGEHPRVRAVLWYQHRGERAW